jgi:hypothetical protein
MNGERKGFVIFLALVSAIAFMIFIGSLFQ